MNKTVGIFLMILGLTWLATGIFSAAQPANGTPQPSSMTSDQPVVQSFADLQNSNNGSLHSVAQIATTGCNNGTTGTGWVVGKNLMLTAAHVVVGSTEVRVGFGYNGDEDIQTARVVGYNPMTDLALLNIDTGDRKVIELSDDPLTMTNYYSVGHPRSRPLEVSALRGVSIGQDRARGYVYTLDGHVEPGDSGSPMFDVDGKAAGLIYATNQYEDGRPSPARIQTYATPTGPIKAAMNASQQTGFATAHPGNCGDAIGIGNFQ